MLKPNAKAVVFRTAMIGGGLSYAVLVPISDVEHYDGTRYTTIVRGEDSPTKRYLDYADATLPEEHFALPKGWDRYDQRLTHERQARKDMLAIARRAFPELRAYPEDSLPSLWIPGLLPVETSAKKTVKL